MYLEEFFRSWVWLIDGKNVKLNNPKRIDEAIGHGCLASPITPACFMFSKLCPQCYKQFTVVQKDRIVMLNILESKILFSSKSSFH